MSTLTSMVRSGVVAAPMALLLAACGTADGGSTDSPRVVATTSILGDVVATIVGEDATVDVLMPAGADPHSFEPSARQAAELRDATLVVANGLGLEPGLGDTLEAAADEGVTVLDVAPHLDPRPFTAGAHHHEDDDAHADENDHEGTDHEEAPDGHEHGDDDGHDHGDEDPHVWHDPRRMADAVPLIADALGEADPRLDTVDLRRRAEAYAEELRALDAEVAEILAAVPAEQRYLLTHHDTFGYLADRYDFEVIGVVIPGGDTLAQPSAAAMVALAAEIEAHDLPAIFSDNTTSPALSETVASEVGRDVEVVPLFTDALGEPGSGADTYVGMIRTNARRIADALG